VQVYRGLTDPLAGLLGLLRHEFHLLIGISHASTLISAILRLVNAAGGGPSRGAPKRSRSLR
jgi:hypothetical protein